MLRSLVATALSYRLLVLLLATITAGLGVWAFTTLPVDAYPNIAQTQVNRLCRLHFGESVQALIDRKLVAAAMRELVF